MRALERRIAKIEEVLGLSSATTDTHPTVTDYHANVIKMPPRGRR
jgi:hypothetical protein